jgi:hypothetical protein
LDAFALTIIGDGQGGYPGVRGHEPDTVAARKSRDRIHRSMNELRALTSNGGSYVSESNFLKEDWQHSYWGPNYARLASVKKKSSHYPHLSRTAQFCWNVGYKISHGR